uniref:TLC domain-containing protein n=1 Tax=Spongospora subterranea TaxID=70186 RepID=A0A0H5R6C7_9EUKA|eukprot:CRZ09297.1 hypothetical protein [Spongospora subterranea]
MGKTPSIDCIVSYLPIIVLSTTIFQIGSAWFRKWIVERRYDSGLDIHELSGRSASTVHALFALFGSWTALSNSPSLHTDHMFGSSPSASIVLAISSGYFVHDTIDCLRKFSTAHIPYLAHHVMASLLYLAGISPCFQYWAIVLLVWEASTPFMNLRWAMIHYKMTDHRLFNAVQILFAIIFVAVRNVWGGYASFLIWMEMLPLCWPGANASLHYLIPVFILMFNILFNTLNGYWALQIVRGFVVTYIIGRPKKTLKAQE